MGEEEEIPGISWNVEKVKMDFPEFPGNSSVSGKLNK